VKSARVRIIGHRRFVEVQLLDNLENLCTPRITFSFHPYRSSWTIYINRKQVPLRLAYVTTFNDWQVFSLLDLLLLMINYILRYPELKVVETLFAEETRNIAQIMYKNLLLHVRRSPLVLYFD
jgi:hypothetical protein